MAGTAAIGHQDTFFSILCEAFPQSNIQITGVNGSTIIKQEYFSDIKNHINDFYSIARPLTLNRKLTLSVRADAYKDEDEVGRMLDGIISMAGSNYKGTRKRELEDNEEKRLLRTLLYADSMEMHIYAVLLAEKLKKEMALERVVCVIECRYGETDDMKNLIKRYRKTSPQDICESVEEGRIILCKYIPDARETIKDQCNEYFQGIQMLISEKCGYVPQIYIGAMVRQAEEYRFSLNAALTTKRAVGEIRSGGRRAHNIFYAEDYLVEYTFYNTDQETLEHFLGAYAEKLRKEPELVKTAKILLENGMNISHASKYGYVHRNTMMLHVRKLCGLLKIDPMNYDGDKFLLMLICEYFAAYDTQIAPC